MRYKHIRVNGYSTRPASTLVSGLYTLNTMAPKLQTRQTKTTRVWKSLCQACECLGDVHHLSWAVCQCLELEYSFSGSRELTKRISCVLGCSPGQLMPQQKL